ncbi:hypothetical protein DPMN_099714 [Dreissena polymorpha]|uniref:Uncharacterized protein n=1 Tax=Dreissena polymorpha TaxID=45954 RepID=A0A9D4R8F6_DREPO|nr:hypothetical protein DPMN_099714 [Dreissena polymorpha]
MDSRSKETKSVYCSEQLQELTGKLHKRIKLIRNADCSEGGWVTVKQFETNPVANDSEDETTIRKAYGESSKETAVF